MYIYIYMCIERERDIYIYIYMFIFIYIYMYPVRKPRVRKLSISESGLPGKPPVDLGSPALLVESLP